MANLKATNVETSLTVDSGTNLATAVTGASVSNDTITFTRANGGTFSVTTSDADSNTWRPIDDTPVDGNTTTSISSNWAFDNVKTPVPANAVFTDTVNTFDGAYSSLSGLPTLGTAAAAATTDFLGASAKAADSELLDGINSTSFWRRDTTNSSDIRFASGHGRGMRFWDSDNYKIWMSSATDGTWGGRVAGETTSDYNMYFRMSGGTNRGFVFQNSTDEIAGIDSGGNGRFVGDVVAYSASDRRLKDNLKPIENACEKVQKLTGYEFDWNENQNVYQGHDIGVVAQEVEEVFPEVVEDRASGYKGVKYEKLVAVLIEANKELQDRVKQLEERIDGLTK